MQKWLLGALKMSKRIIPSIFVIYFIILVMSISCSSSPRSQYGTSLDIGLRDSTNYLNERIQPNSKVIVLNFTSQWPALSEYIIDELIGYIVNEGNFMVVERDNLEIIRQELNFQLSGEVSDETAQSIGQILGAQTIISGAINKIGDAYRLRIRAISVETAEIIGMQNLDIKNDNRMISLTKDGNGHTIQGRDESNNILQARGNSSNVSQTITGRIISPKDMWIPGTVEIGGNAPTKNLSINVESFAGLEREAVSLEIEFLGTNRFGQFVMWNEPIVQLLRNGSGVRFKVVGDGLPWLFGVGTVETNTEYNDFYIDINPMAGPISIIDVPYSKLQQPPWGERQVFNKNNILYFKFWRDGYGKTDKETSVLKIFDFEIY